jgi:SHS2 domain-containing protein
MIRWLDHTADVQLEITSAHYKNIFVGLVEGLKQLLVTGGVKITYTVPIFLEEEDPAALLVSLGREVLIHFNTRRFVPSHLDIMDCSLQYLKGTLHGEILNLAHQAFHREVKGITYHNLKVTREARKWRAVVTFDV